MKSELIFGDTPFTTLAAGWNDLAGRGMTDTPFQLLAYQKGWWTHLGVGELVTVVVRNDDGVLQAIAPFYLHDNTLALNGGVDETDYLDIICEPDQAEGVWQAVLDCLASDACPAWTTLDLHNIPAASPTRVILPQLAEERGFLFTTAVEEVCPIITLPDTFDGYLDMLTSKERRETKRKLRRGHGAGAVLEVVTEHVHEAVDDFLKLLQLSTYDKGDWVNEGRTRLFHEVAEAGLNAGILQLIFLNFDGDRAAALFNFAYKGRIWVYNSGLDPQKYARLGAGVILTAKAIEHAIEQGNTSFDLMRGDEAYKYKIGAKDTEIYNIKIERTKS